jgi:dephospho-CoA kinase
VESDRRIAAACGAYVIHVVPLLVESRDRQRVSRVVVVDCPEAGADRTGAATQQAITDEEIRRIIRSQASREDRLAAADDVIDNSGSLDALHKQVRQLHAKYLELARSPA